MRKFWKRIITLVVIILIIVFGIYYWPGREAKADVHVEFVMEAYDVISENYWIKGDMPDYFAQNVASTFKLPVKPTLVTNDRAGVEKMIIDAFKVANSADEKKEFALKIVGSIMNDLPPVGVNALRSDKEEVAFREGISNIDRSKDLYAQLNLETGAPIKKVEEAYEKKVKLLENATSTEAKAELEQLVYAKEVLTNQNTKKLYDEEKIEPTISSEILDSTLYFYIGKIAPTTLLEFAQIVEAASTTPRVNNMIIDLRGNLGGTLDFANHFLGLFLGMNQFAYDLFHQGDHNVQRTMQPRFVPLAKYKEIAILADGMTQSTAEVISAAFKRFNLGTVVGEKTRGWGTVEATIPLKTVIDEDVNYALFMVHSLTLRDDNEPIADKGVDPDVDIKTPTWKGDLSNYFRSAGLIKNIQNVIVSGPLK